MTSTSTYGALVEYHTGTVLADATLPELARSILASRTDGGAGVIDVGGRDCYVAYADLSHAELARIASELGIDLAHDCDEDSPECECWDPVAGRIGYAPDEDEYVPHPRGDSRCDAPCPTACSHDLRRIAEAAS
jgi:hypothetical protein